MTHETIFSLYCLAGFFLGFVVSVFAGIKLLKILMVWDQKVISKSKNKELYQYQPPAPLSEITEEDFAQLSAQDKADYLKTFLSHTARVEDER